MKTRYVAFDIETAKVIAGESFVLQAHRPLGIACAATLTSDSRELRLWHGKTGERPAPRMRAEELATLLDYLCEQIAKGYTLLTWNGLAFDFDILAEESDDLARCVALASSHVDMMFHAVCCLGHRIGIDKVAQGMGLPGKPPGMSGVKAPEMWAAGQHKEVLDYVSRDVEMAIAIAAAGDERRGFNWITQRGQKKYAQLPSGWLRVDEALQLPMPDTSWMTDPPSRSDFTCWMRSAR